MDKAGLLSSVYKSVITIDFGRKGTLYQGADQTHPHNKKHRINGFPKDSFHFTCIAHKTRLQNILRSTGIDPIEKSLLKQRFINLAAAHKWYIEKQKKALGI